MVKSVATPKNLDGSPRVNICKTTWSLPTMNVDHFPNAFPGFPMGFPHLFVSLPHFPRETKRFPHPCDFPLV